MKADIKGWDVQEAEEWAVKAGLEPYRGRQIRHWLLVKLVGSSEEMSNIPKEIRDLAEKELLLNPLKTVRTEQSEDGTVKFIFEL
ncbi:MAG TPA: 23S rRNA (adenine(2503)-C(2))-methyltransferase RlmN, partial [Deltaproteobacteria bacterium]|nr:23S rRNA (adenine(2503)-C(2))-methyltransferase RlmN [Deltaproteobacteria bacterium]